MRRQKFHFRRHILLSPSSHYHYKREKSYWGYFESASVLPRGGGGGREGEWEKERRRRRRESTVG